MPEVESWRGYFAASPTPFSRDGELDLSRLRDILSWFLSQRPHGLVVNGTTGEWVAQTVDERQRVAEVARESVPGDLPFLVGIGGIRAEESVELGRHAASIGADGVLLTVPAARWLNDDEIVGFYAEAARRIPLPILIYNVPVVTGTDHGPELLERLLAIDGVVGVKDNTPSPEQRLATLRRLGRDGAIFSDVLEPGSFPTFAQGYGRGQIGSGMPLGSRLARAMELVWDGESDRAHYVVEEFAAFKKAILRAALPGQPWHAQIKAIMFAGGVDAGFPRFPTASLRDHPEAMKRVTAVVDEYLEKI